MEGFDKEAFGDRLQAEITERGWSVSDLQEKLKETVRKRTGRTRGTSYGSVWSYVNGQAPESGPRQEVVSALVELLDVLPGYLIHGGPATKEERALREDRGDEEPGFYEEIRTAIPQLERLDYVVAVAFMTHLHRWVKAHLRVDYQVEEDEVVRYAESVWDYLNAPFQAWSERIGKEVPVDPNGVSDYMMAMLHALNFSLQVVAPSGITHEDVESWPSLHSDEED